MHKPSFLSSGQFSWRLRFAAGQLFMTQEIIGIWAEAIEASFWYSQEKQTAAVLPTHYLTNT
jgi:hypothetical protein